MLGFIVIILSVLNGGSSVYTLAPIIIILLFILAAAGLNRGTSIFNLFGLGALMGIGAGVGKGSAGKGLRSSSALQRNRMRKAVSGAPKGPKNMSAKKGGVLRQKMGAKYTNWRINRQIKKGNIEKARGIANKTINKQIKNEGEVAAKKAKEDAVKSTVASSIFTLSYYDEKTPIKLKGPKKGNIEKTSWLAVSVGPTFAKSVISKKSNIKNNKGQEIAPPSINKNNKGQEIAPPTINTNNKGHGISPPTMPKPTELELHKQAVNKLFDNMKNGNISENDIVYIRSVVNAVKIEKQKLSSVVAAEETKKNIGNITWGNIEESRKAAIEAAHKREIENPASGLKKIIKEHPNINSGASQFFGIGGVVAAPIIARDMYRNHKRKNNNISPPSSTEQESTKNK
ncbi:MAG: hypothetical protein M1538_03380 [Candidatus Marsarchaeota archaeon]|nr:hypothetical protein [Candidatus Marsarchaeota archaeon]